MGKRGRKERRAQKAAGWRRVLKGWSFRPTVVEDLTVTDPEYRSRYLQALAHYRGQR